MRLSQIWDYVMRRKILLFVVLIFVVALGRFCGNFGHEKNNSLTPEVPRTGEIINISDQEDGCNISAEELNHISLGGGESSLEESDLTEEGITFWNREMPDSENILGQTNNSAKTEILIISLGIVAVVAVLLVARFIFDHYVR